MVGRRGLGGGEGLVWTRAGGSGWEQNFLPAC